MLRLKQLGGSHAASPLRWRGSFGGSFGSTFAAICFSFLYRVYPCLQHLHLGLLHFFPPLMGFVTACVRKPNLPRNGAWRASCPSRVLRLRCFDILLKLPDWYVHLIVRPNALPCYRVQASANPEEPSPATVWPVQCLWFDPFINQVILSLGPQRPGFEVAT